VGHYSRRDVFTLLFNDQPLGPVKRNKDIADASSFERALPTATAAAPGLPLNASDLQIPKLPSAHASIESELHN
jgi:hypothetical protein